VTGKEFKSECIHFEAANTITLTADKDCAFTDLALYDVYGNAIAIDSLVVEGKVATITICEDMLGEATKPQLATLDLIREHGLLAATSGNGNPVYKICLNYLRDKANRTLTTIQNHIRQLAAKKVILYTAPFNGKITKFIRPVTPMELAAAEIRRNSERDKFQAVREYIMCPDDQKHKYLNDYFSL
jgi:hypothetical protein